ncbi:MAG: 2-phospho-L-lactate guanylyltransferase [Lapillicoccus sp.]
MSDWINDRTPRDGTRAGRGLASVPTGTSAGRPPEAWHVVVPVKGGPDAKSRLRAPYGVDRLVLARALALDTVGAAAAAVGADHVVVVTSDPEVLEAVGKLGARTLPDPGRGLNEAVRTGLGAVAPDHPAAVLLGDVPALRADDLRAALASADAYDCWFVPDAEGTGTVLLGAREAESVRPRFGSGSADRHEADGHSRLELELDRLRRDVDDAASLGEALRLGVGPSTAGLLAHLIGL